MKAKNMIQRIFIIVVFLIVPLLVQGGSGEAAAEVLTFDQAAALALKQNFQIEMARNTTVIAKNNVHIGNAGLLPRLDVSGSVKYQGTTGTGAPAASSSLGWGTDYTVQASYTLFDGFGNIYRYKRLKGEEALSQLEAQIQIEDTLIAVSQAYYSAASAAENLRIASELLEISKQRLQRAEKRAIYGQANTVEVLSARVDYNNDRVTVAQAQLNWRESKRNLNILLNRDISHDFNIAPGVVFMEVSPLENLQQRAKNNNASYLAAIQNVRQAGWDLRIARADYFPKLDLSASYGDNSGWQLSAGLNWNLFDGFQKNISRKNAQINLKNRQLSQQQMHQEITKEVTSAYETYKHSRLVLKLEEENLEASQTNFQRTRELYHLGQVTTTQFREAQLNLIQGKSNISNAQYTAKLNELFLLRLTGNLISKNQNPF